MRGGKVQTQEYADDHGYKMVVTISMANDYNGYIATYRDFMNHDHYRKALTGWGPHSSDYYATRLTQMGHALKGDAEARAEDRRRDRRHQGVAARPAPRSSPRSSPTRLAEEAKVLAVGEAVASAGPCRLRR